MAEKKLIDQIKKVDLSDFKVLVIGVILLIIPIFVLMKVSNMGKKSRMSTERVKTMVNRKQIFNFPQSEKNASGKAASGSNRKAGTGWFADTPEKKVQIELEDALKLIQRTRRAENFPSGMTSDQKNSYRAENNPYITSGNGELENGRLKEAEKLFEMAFAEAGDNIFQKVHAMSGLCEVYTRMNDPKKLEQAFNQFMDLVALLPPEFGGGDLRTSVKNAYLHLKKLKDQADPGKVAEALGRSSVMKNTQMDASQVHRGLSKALVAFPVKFDEGGNK